MTTIADSIRARRDDIIRIAARHGARNIRVFGSVARGDAGPESDLDLLVDAGPVTTNNQAGNWDIAADCLPRVTRTSNSA